MLSNSQCELSPHDTLLLFTDGLFEVEGPGGDIYDYRRLLEAVNRRRELPAFQLCHERFHPDAAVPGPCPPLHVPRAP